MAGPSGQLFHAGIGLLTNELDAFRQVERETEVRAANLPPARR